MKVAEEFSDTECSEYNNMDCNHCIMLCANIIFLTFYRIMVSDYMVFCQGFYFTLR